MKTEWRGFKGTHWVDEVDVRDFVQITTLPMTAMIRSCSRPQRRPQALGYPARLTERRAGQGWCFGYGNASGFRHHGLQKLPIWVKTPKSLKKLSVFKPISP